MLSTQVLCKSFGTLVKVGIHTPFSWKKPWTGTIYKSLNIVDIVLQPAVKRVDFKNPPSCVCPPATNHEFIQP
jgi:hypothetical protein